MKKLVTLISGLLLATAAAHADFAYWKINVTDTKSGGGTVLKNKWGGFLVADMDANKFRLIVTTGVKFQVISNDNATLQYVTTALGKETAAIFFPSTDQGGFALRGAATYMDLGFIKSYWVPKTLTAEGCSITTNGSDTFIEEYSGTLTFDSSDTSMANPLIKSLDQAVAGVISYLRGKGYQPN